VELVDRVNLESIGQIIPVLGGEDPIAAYRSTKEKNTNTIVVFAKGKDLKTAFAFFTSH
jgi:hypothetical protein